MVTTRASTPTAESAYEHVMTEILEQGSDGPIRLGMLKYGYDKERDVLPTDGLSY